MIAGVCGGLAEYFSVDPTLLRIAFVALAFLNGAGLILYIILAIVMPEEEKDSEKKLSAEADTSAESAKDNVAKDSEVQQVKEEAHFKEKEGKEVEASTESQGLRTIFGAALVTLGLFFLLQQIFPWLQIRWQFVWPFVIIIVGLLIIFKPEK